MNGLNKKIEGARRVERERVRKGFCVMTGKQFDVLTELHLLRKKARKA